MRKPATPIPVDRADFIATMYGYDQVVIIATMYGYDQVVIIARRVGDDGVEHVTTYGTTSEHREVAAHIGQFLKHLMGWTNETVHEDYRITKR